jgi:Type II intron maturase
MVQRQIVRKHMMLKIKKGILLRENYSKETSAQIYYVRCHYNFLMGFFMNKAQSRWIMENLFKYIKEKLNFDVSKKLLRHISSDKINFLGFEIHWIPVCTSKQFTNKKLEVYKRHQNKNFREGVRDYMQFLKAVEWMSRETIMGVVVNKILSQTHIIAEKELKKRIAGLVPQEYWFYYGSKSDQKMELALKIRYEDQYFKLHKWINAKKGLLNSRKPIRLIRVKGENWLNGNQKLMELKHERFYSLKLHCVTTNVAKMESISALKILFPKPQVIAEFKRKNVLNSQGAPGVMALKTILSDIAIICWYSRISKRLLSYYGCITSFNDLRHLVNSILRYSLLGTIRVKYSKSMSWVTSHFGFDPKVKSKNKWSIHFPSLVWINSRRKKYATQAWGRQNLDFMRNTNLLYLNQMGIMLDSFKCKSLH